MNGTLGDLRTEITKFSHLDDDTPVSWLDRVTAEEYVLERMVFDTENAKLFVIAE